MEEEEKSKSIVQNIKKQLTCFICGNVFQDPRILPCLHSFCQRCLVGMVRRKKEVDKAITCPTCHQDFLLEVSSLPRNTLLNISLDLMSIHSGGDVKCDVCDDSISEELASAVARCRECAVYLCKLHEESHRRAKLTRRHTIFSKRELLVASANDGGFQVLNRNGEPLRHISPPKLDADSSLFIPEEIVIDKDNNILAIDSNINCILVLSEKGELLARCATNNVINPYGIAIDKMGRIVVCDSTNIIKIF